MYGIQQSYINHVTGERWTRRVKKQWKTYRGAMKAASSINYAWVCIPDGKTRIEEMSAQVVEA